ncbi:hypothetical protein ASE40_10070 [Flavobacterium sp. Root935]|jgi:hypothetical protein|uniref:hypothetical protein n=1 Tax=unclassified Flavobacterium TaxID=196869 RepID=UPI0007102879|nr:MULTISPECIES: hypothetical protein [unclassified Flavobacterium]KRD61855.1 hypothetical protein ASE40_10070 [Flavobacterium sp. Root935]MDQ1167100.1 hypothetical protein [Flavobacterium sp. SORGH_AS_0622]TDX12259.1 hypothetical protein EDB96_1314 [Flavobacterium sp. S87F.05.LMB.W.Kidney.N]
MKKFLLILTVLFALTAYSQKKKVAVVSFYTDKTIDLSDLGLNSIAAVTDLGNNPNFNLAPILEKYHNAFFNDYAKKFPFDLVPESEVTQKQEYIDFTPKFAREGDAGSTIINYPGYKYIYEGINGSTNEVASAKIFSEKADGVLFTEIHFALQKGFAVGGTGTVKMRAYARIALYDKNGKKVFAFNEGANSKKTGTIVGGIPVLSFDKVLPMCESALDELLKDLDGKIEKMVKKTSDNL